MKENQVFKLLEQPSTEALDAQLCEPGMLGEIVVLANAEDTKERVWKAMSGRKKPEGRDRTVDIPEEMFAYNRSTKFGKRDLKERSHMGEIRLPNGFLLQVDRTDIPCAGFQKVRFEFWGTEPEPEKWGFIEWEIYDGVAYSQHRELDESIRGYGLGKTLVELSDDFFRENGIRRAIMTTQKSSTALFFVHHGYMPDFELDEDMTECIVSCAPGEYGRGHMTYSYFANDLVDFVKDFPENS